MKNLWFLELKVFFQFLGAKFRQRAKKVMITRPLRRLSSITKPHPSEFEETLFTRISTYSSRSSTQTSRNSSGYKITIAFNKIIFSKIFVGFKQIWITIPQTAQGWFGSPACFQLGITACDSLDHSPHRSRSQTRTSIKSKHFKSHCDHNDHCKWNPFRNKLPETQFNKY